MVNYKMVEDLVNLGIKSDDTVLMHSSLKSLGYVEGGASTVIDSLLYVLSDGTLLIPALSFATVRPEIPIFSQNDTPSCVGAISEYFRKTPNVLRSLHPTHSVCAYGKRAYELTREHIDTTTPVGEKSPFALLPKVGGKILMLGCGLRPNTSMHGVEELTVPPYLFREKMIEYTITDKDGNTFKKDYHAHNFKGVGQRYDRLSEIMDIPHGKVLEADAYLIDAKEMWDKAHAKLEENEFFFVDK